MGLFDKLKKPKKQFEDFFTELQADMVDICLEYAENYTDMIYIYCSCEPDIMAADVFYRINGECLRKNKINDAPGEHPTYTTTAENQRTVIKVLMEDLDKIKALCEEHNRPMPTQMKLYFNGKTRAFDANYIYDIVCSNDSEKLPTDVFSEWFIEESKK